MTIGKALQKISPLWIGVAISAFLLALFFSAESLLGRWEALLTGDVFDPLARVSGGVLRDVRISIIHCLLVGYISGAFLYTIRSGRRTVLELRGALDCTREECRDLAAATRLSRRGLIVAGLAGLALGLLGPYLAPPVPEAPWHPSSWSAEVFWHRILGPAMLVLVVWHAYAIVSVSRRMSHLARRLRRIDLLDLTSLEPFTRLGLSNALLVIGGLSIFSLMLIESGLGTTMVALGIPLLLVAVLALLYPVRGVHDRIQQTKDVELQTINAAISAERSTFLEQDSRHRRGEMADLVAYRGLIESVPEWPFTSSNYARFILYLLIPVLSWGLGMVAEELIGRTLL